jgi:hypothetical protein
MLIIGLQLCVPNLFNSISCKSKRKIRSLSDMLAFNQDAALKDATTLADGGDKHGNKRESNTAENKKILNMNTATPTGPPPGSDPSGDPETGSRIKTKDVVNLLLKFAGFLTRSQGDIESADQVFKKALEVNVHVYVSIHKRVHIYIYIYMYIYIDMLISAYVYIFMYIYVYVCHIHIYAYVCTYIYIYMYMYIFIYIFESIYMHK